MRKRRSEGAQEGSGREVTTPKKEVVKTLKREVKTGKDET